MQRTLSLVVLCIGLSASANALDGTVVGTGWGGFWYNSGDLIVIDAATQQQTTIVSGSCYGASFSPDGTQIAYFKNENSIWICNIDGSNDHMVTDNTGWSGESHSCANWISGDWIYWGAGRNLKRVKADGSQRNDNVHIAGFDLMTCRVSQDGSRAACFAPGWHVERFYVGGSSMNLGGGCQGSISPDGNYVTHNLDHSHYQVHNFADGSEAAYVTAPPGDSNNHCFSHLSNDHVLVTLNGGSGYVQNWRNGQYWHVGNGFKCWDYNPNGSTTPPPQASMRDPDSPPGATVSGLNVEYYEVSGVSSVPNYDSMTPYATDSVQEIDFPSTSGTVATSGRSDDLGARFTGYVDASSDGVYTFFTESDDGSKLYIGSTEVVNNDGAHGMVEQSGTIGLKAGTHAFTVVYYEGGGGAGLIVRFTPPGGSKGVIPSSVFRRIDTGPNPAAVVNGTAASVTESTAQLAGEVVSTGGENPTVTVYWGTADAGTDAGAWQSTQDLGARSAGAFTHDVSGLNGSTIYYFTCSATNAAGTVWAPFAASFQTADAAQPPPGPTLAEISVSPSDSTIAADATLSLTASPYDEDGNTMDVPVYWTASGGTVAPSSGTSTTFTPDAIGTFAITAISGDVAGTASVTVTEVPAITLNEPAGGEIWYIGTTRHIRWSTTGLDNVTILYTPNSGTNMNLINSSVQRSAAEWGNYDWTIPDDADLPSDDCYVSISSYWGEYPTSSGTFAIHAISDGDGDGMDDGWELDTFSNADQDGTADSDGDGLTDYEEFMNGSDPLEADTPIGGASNDEDTSGSSLSCSSGRDGSRSSLALLMFMATIWLVARRRPTGTARARA